MKRFLAILVALGLVGAAPAARASCHRVGTQLHCTLGGEELSIGTQAAAGAGPARPAGALPLHGDDDLFDERPGGGWPLRLELQNVGRDPGLCWRFGDETYCH